MKYKTNKKDVMSSYSVVLSSGYCELQTLLTFIEPQCYTEGLYGWNCDVYEFPEYDVAITTGYRPFGNVKLPHDELAKYEREAIDIAGNWVYTVDEQQECLSNILIALLIKARDVALSKNT